MTHQDQITKLQAAISAHQLAAGAHFRADEACRKQYPATAELLSRQAHESTCGAPDDALAAFHARLALDNAEAAADPRNPQSGVNFREAARNHGAAEVRHMELAADADSEIRQLEKVEVQSRNTTMPTTAEGDSPAPSSEGTEAKVATDSADLTEANHTLADVEPSCCRHCRSWFHVTTGAIEEMRAAYPEEPMTDEEAANLIDVCYFCADMPLPNLPQITASPPRHLAALMIEQLRTVGISGLAPCYDSTEDYLADMWADLSCIPEQLIADIAAIRAHRSYTGIRDDIARKLNIDIDAELVQGAIEAKAEIY